MQDQTGSVPQEARYAPTVRSAARAILLARLLIGFALTAYFCSLIGGAPHRSWFYIEAAGLVALPTMMILIWALFRQTWVLWIGVASDAFTLLICLFFTLLCGAMGGPEQSTIWLISAYALVVDMTLMIVAIVHDKPATPLI